VIGYYLSGLASNCNPPDLCLVSSYDYRHEPLAPGYIAVLNFRKWILIYHLLYDHIRVTYSFHLTIYLRSFDQLVPDGEFSLWEEFYVN
jgi:hypothetical protein